MIVQNVLQKNVKKSQKKVGDRMPYIDPEVVLEAKRMDLLTYLRNYESTELVKLSRNTYTTRTHDSLKISNGKWMWWSRGIGGRSALDYLVKVKGLNFIEAVETITGKTASRSPVYVREKPNTEQRPLLLPEKSKTTDKVFEYLFNRGIDYEIISDCINKGYIFESLPYHNVVFVGYDEHEKPKYAAYRSTNSIKLMGDCSGSQKQYSFRLDNGYSDEVHIFECAIDLLSYATLYKLQGKDWRNLNLVSLAGVYSPKKDIESSKVPIALDNFLSKHQETEKIFLHLDNDIAGRNATKAMQFLLSDKYEVIDSPPHSGKDFNDFLCFKLGIQKVSERSLER